MDSSAHLLLAPWTWAGCRYAYAVCQRV